MCSARSKYLLLFVGAIVIGASADVIYVNANQASGAHNGSSWTNAYQDLQQALENAAEGDEI